MKIIIKLQGQRWLIWTIVFLFVSLGGLATYIMYSASLESSEPVEVQTFAGKYAKLNSTGSVGVAGESATYINKTIPDGNYIQLTSGAGPAVLEKINQDLKEAAISSSCFGDPEDPQSVEQMRQDYVWQAKAWDKPVPNLSQLSYAQMRKKLMSDFDYYDVSSQSVTFADRGLLSVVVRYDTFCGGAHPAGGSFGINYDLATGKEVAFAELFKNYSSNKEIIKGAIVDFLSQGVEAGSLCDYDSQYDMDSDKPVSFVFSDAGLQLLSLGFPHAALPCEPDGLVFPLGSPAKYLKPQFQFLVDPQVLNKQNDVIFKASQAVKQYHLTVLNEECLAYSLGTGTAEYHQIEVRKNRNNPKCGGDPAVSPLLFTVRVSKLTGQMTTDAESSGPGLMKPLGAGQ